ncbi:MAG TPA: FixH family protein [Burkholderiales bacterium]|nr:FixH family protein [Burkholderiales bacterium]
MQAMTHGRQPWYREPWPWLLMSGPAAVVVAGAFTAWLAVVNEDGLVAEDYYKQGLSINKVIRRESAAAALGVKARVLVGEHGLRVQLAGAAPAALTLQLVHPTRAGMDRTVRLQAEGGGWYAGRVDVAAGRWKVAIEDDSGVWRIAGAAADVRPGAELQVDARGMAEAGG